MNMKEKIKDNSPKTPGGISKSLLTPCRRVGLSRKWKGASPSFISPLAGSQPNVVQTEVKQEKKETRKRKQRVCDEETEDQADEKPCTPIEENIDNLGTDEAELTCTDEKIDVVGTPVRHVEGLVRKKSKLIANLRKKASKENLIEEPVKIVEAKQNENDENSDSNVDKDISKSPDTVSAPVRKKSKIKTKKGKSPSTKMQGTPKKREECPTSNENTDSVQPSHSEGTKQKSPKELTKECIVVIQKKIFKVDKNKTTVIENTNETKNPVSQTLFDDSDNEDVPLSHLNKVVEKKDDPCNKPVILNSENIINVKIKNDNEIISDVITIDDDSDFINTPEFKEEVRIKPKMKSKQNNEPKKKNLLRKPAQIDTKPSSQSSFDDDDDFDFENKKTILIRKTYEKPTKPLKAKSTGSITQKDIDEIKARIEMKKKLLLAKAMCKDTEELRGLIKKWQKGCQEALMELMELMRNKFPERQNMDYSEMLHMLRIPPALVGYDSENEIFNTPNDASIILSKFNYL